MLWLRFILGATAMALHFAFLVRLYINARLLRVQGLNGEIGHLYDVLKRWSWIRFSMTVMMTLSAINPSVNKDRLAMVFFAAIAVYAGVLCFRDQAEQETWAAERLSQQRRQKEV